MVIICLYFINDNEKIEVDTDDFRLFKTMLNTDIPVDKLDDCIVVYRDLDIFHHVYNYVYKNEIPPFDMINDFINECKYYDVRFRYIDLVPPSIGQGRANIIAKRIWKNPSKAKYIIETYMKHKTLPNV